MSVVSSPNLSLTRSEMARGGSIQTPASAHDVARGRTAQRINPSEATHAAPETLKETSNIGQQIIQKIGETLTSWKESIQTTITRIITKHPKMTAAILGTIATASVIFGLAAGGILPIAAAAIIFLLDAALYNFSILYA